MIENLTGGSSPSGSGNGGYYAEVLSVNDYYAFGGQKPKRSYNSDEYRYGFNGKEKDDEVKGNGNSYDYGFRIYDSRIARFLSVDPLTGFYPWYTPYQFAGNGPVWAIDLDGLEEKVIVGYNHVEIRATYVAEQKVVDNVDIAQLNITVNNLFNNNPQNQPAIDVDLGLPDLMINDGSDGPGPEKVTFKIDIVPQPTDNKVGTDIEVGSNGVYKEMNDGPAEDIGGLILMGDINRDYNVYDENGKIVGVKDAYWNGQNIILNPLFFDKSAEGYHGYGPQYDDEGNEVARWKGTPGSTIQHEIGHDLGLTHPENVYPPYGTMSAGGGSPSQEEMNTLTSPENSEIIQPGANAKPR